MSTRRDELPLVQSCQRAWHRISFAHTEADVETYLDRLDEGLLWLLESRF